MGRQDRSSIQMEDATIGKDVAKRKDLYLLRVAGVMSSNSAFYFRPDSDKVHSKSSPLLLIYSCY